MKHIAVNEEESVDQIIDISTISSSVPVSPMNGTITDKITNYSGENNIFHTNQSKLNTPIADSTGNYKDNDRSIPDEDEAPMDGTINVDRSQPSSSENDNRTNKACQSDKTSKDSLQASHLERSVAMSNANKSYKCQICDRNFKYSSRLITHNRIHTGEKPYRCKVCGQSFNQSNHLAHHVLIHTGEKPFKCSACDKCFRQKTTLTTHMLIHTGVKPFKCFECEKCFHRNLI